jgi:hypothetical protein
MKGGLPSAPRRIGDGERVPAQLLVKGTDWIPETQPEAVAKPASVPGECKRTSTSLWEICGKTCVLNMNSKPR